MVRRILLHPYNKSRIYFEGSWQQCYSTCFVICYVPAWMKANNLLFVTSLDIKSFTNTYICCNFCQLALCPAARWAANHLIYIVFLFKNIRGIVFLSICNMSQHIKMVNFTIFTLESDYTDKNKIYFKFKKYIML